MTRAKLFLILCTLALGCLLATQVEAAKGQLTDQEEYVMEQVAAGKVADLKARFGKKEEDRTLPASFIKDLITGGYKVHWKGVQIKNAVVTEPLDLERAEVPHTVELIDCKFREQVICLHAVFEKHLFISGSCFEKEGNFQRINVKKNFFSVYSIFQGPVDFRSADIGGKFIADGAQFQNEKVVAIFNGLKVGRSAFLINSTFKGSVDFTTAEIGGQFAANGVQFLSQENMVKFNAIRVGQDAFFENAIFKGPVDFRCAEVVRQFNANGAQFLSQEKMANFNSLKVGQIAMFKGAKFRGPVDFGGADIGGQFIADGAQFFNPEKEANFGYLKVGESAFFNKATFLGQVYFDSANISWQFIADKARFLNKGNSASFIGMRVGQEAFIQDATFKSNVDFSYGTYLDLRLNGTDEKKQERALKLYLTGTTVKRKLSLKNFKLETLEASHLRVKGPATFAEVTITEEADFQNANIEALEFKNFQLDKEKATLNLDGLTYNALCVDELHNFPGLLGLVDRAAFNPQNYLELEKYFTRSGHQDWADKVFITMKDRELEQMAWYDPRRWLIGFFWGWLVGYGRQPWGVLYVIVPLIAVGTFLFAPKFEEEFVKSNSWLRGISAEHPWIIKFLLSLDRFLPGVDLGLAKEWSPVKVDLFTFSYWHFLKLSGWITIPIALAAIYTQIK